MLLMIVLVLLMVVDDFKGVIDSFDVCIGVIDGFYACMTGLEA